MCCLIDTTLEVSMGSSSELLVVDQTQNDHFIPGHEFQRFKAPGTVTVVFQQQPMMFEGIE